MRQKAQLPKGWKYCLNDAVAFKPRAQNAGDQKFCSANCRKEFWKHGGVSVHKLKLHVQQWVAETCAPLQTAIEELKREVSELKTKSTAQPKLRNGRDRISQQQESVL